MLAARQGHAEVVQALRDAGVEYDDAAATLLRGWRLGREGRVAGALAAYAEAQALDSTLAIFPAAWAALCRYGALWEHGAEVTPACERAVALTPESDRRHPGARFARALARAAAGDLEGAAADLEPSLDAENEDEDESELRQWIDILRAGRNPFTPEALKSLREG